MSLLTTFKVSNNFWGSSRSSSDFGSSLNRNHHSQACPKPLIHTVIFDDHPVDTFQYKVDIRLTDRPGSENINPTLLCFDRVIDKLKLICTCLISQSIINRLLFVCRILLWSCSNNWFWHLISRKHVWHLYEGVLHNSDQ